MDYERKELVDWIRGIYQNLDEADKQDALRFFPELRESEEDRTRKEIINYLDFAESHNLLRAADYEKKKGWLAYLEKQKENPKSAVEVLARAGLKPYKDGNQWCILAGDNIQEGICGFGYTIDEALYQFLMEVLEKQKEQKPEIKYVYPKFRKGDVIEPIIPNGHFTPVRVVNIWDGSYSCRSDDDKAHLSLPIRNEDEYRLVEQKPAEWSEEDERIRQGLIEKYKNEHLVSVQTGIHLKDIIRFLENLHPSWKPSELSMVEDGS